MAVSDLRPLLHAESRSFPSCKLDRAGSGPELVLPLPDALRATCYLQEGGQTAGDARVTRKLMTACALSATFMIVEVVGGYFAGSISVMADAAHMFSDVLAFVVSLYCTRMVAKRTSASFSFGYHRAETVGALISILIICVITGALVLEAVQRLIAPSPINGRLMFVIAVVGIGFNLLLLLTLGHEHHHHGPGGCSGGGGHSHGHGHSATDHGRGHHHGHGHGGCGGHGHGLGGGGGHGHGHGPAAAHRDHAGSSGSDEGHSHEPAAAAAGDGCGGHEHGHDDPRDGAAAATDAVQQRAAAYVGNIGGMADAAAPPSGQVPEAAPSASSCDHAVVACGRADGLGHGDVAAPREDLGEPDERADALGASLQTLSHDGHAHGGRHTHGNQNLRGAILHVMGDLLQSLGVALAGLVIWLTDGSSRWLWVDPACTFFFAIGVVWVTKSLVRNVLSDLMEAAPDDVNLRALLGELEAAEGVTGVHDMHVWTIGSGKHILTAHVNAQDETHPYELVQRLETLISAHGIHHSTVQICSGRVAMD